MFRKLIVAVALTICAATSFAGNTVLDTSGLSDSQVAELKAHAAAVVAQAAKQADGTVAAAVASPSATMTLAATWGQQAAAAAEGFAKALGIAAKELGVTMNDFLHTDAGKLTAALIVWKLAGASIVHMLYGFLFISGGLLATRMLYLQLFTQGYEKVEYNRFFGMFKGTKLVRIPKGFHDLESDGEWLAFWILIFALIGTFGFGAMFF